MYESMEIIKDIIYNFLSNFLKEQLLLQEENEHLRAELELAKVEIKTLRLQMSDYKHHNLYQFMKQLEMLNTKVQTDV